MAPPFGFSCDKSYAGADPDFWKGGSTARCVIIVGVGVAGICTIIVCEAHMSMQSMPILGGLGACPAGNFEKLHSQRLNMRAFLVIYHP